MTHHESKLTLDIIDELKREREMWKSRADGHEQDYLAMLKRIDEVVKERDEVRANCEVLENVLAELYCNHTLYGAAQELIEAALSKAKGGDQ